MKSKILTRLSHSFKAIKNVSPTIQRKKTQKNIKLISTKVAADKLNNKVTALLGKENVEGKKQQKKLEKLLIELENQIVCLNLADISNLGAVDVLINIVGKLWGNLESSEMNESLLRRAEELKTAYLHLLTASKHQEQKLDDRRRAPSLRHNELDEKNVYYVYRNSTSDLYENSWLKIKLVDNKISIHQQFIKSGESQWVTIAEKNHDTFLSKGVHTLHSELRKKLTFKLAIDKTTGTPQLQQITQIPNKPSRNIRCYNFRSKAWENITAVEYNNDNNHEINFDSNIIHLPKQRPYSFAQKTLKERKLNSIRSKQNNNHFVMINTTASQIPIPGFLPAFSSEQIGRAHV